MQGLVFQLWLQQLLSLPAEFLRASAMLLLGALVFVPIERWLGRRPQVPRREHLGQDVAYLYLGVLMPPFISGTAALLLQALGQQWLPSFLREAIASWPLALKFGAAVFCGELSYYWAHRWAHEWPWLWRFHAIHHSPQRVDWLVNTRAHPVELGITRSISGVPAALLGLSLASPGATTQSQLLLAAGFAVGSSLWAFFVHLDVRWRFGPLEWLLTTPAFHHWHHANDDPSVVNKNYAALLPLMDRVFGTFHLPRTYPERYGTNTALPATLWGQLLFPFKRVMERGISPDASDPPTSHPPAAPPARCPD